MRHSTENVQQQRPFTTIATKTSTNVNNINDYNSNESSSCNSSNNDTIPSLLSSDKYGVNNNKNNNNGKNLINRHVSAPVTDKLIGRKLSVASVNALYNEYLSKCYNDSEISSQKYRIEHDLSMNRINNSSANSDTTIGEKRRGTPIPDLDNSFNSNNKKFDKHESLMEDLDDIIESPNVPRRFNNKNCNDNETNIWINTSTTSDETVAADSSDRQSNVLMGQKSTDR